jgi:hypothetical protein
MIIKNYTHYNTDDLATLLKRVEEHIEGLTGVAANPRVDRVEFHESKPASALHQVRRWSDTSHTYVSVCERKWVGSRYTEPQRVNLLTPSKLYDTALEALTAATLNDVQIVPKEMVQAVLVELRGMYFFDAYHFPNIVPDPAGLVLRIENKVAAKVPVSAKQKVKLTHAQRNARWGRGSLKDAHSAVSKAIRYLELAQNFGKSETTGIAELLATVANLQAALLNAYSRDAVNVIQIYQDALEVAEQESAK